MTEFTVQQVRDLLLSNHQKIRSLQEEKFQKQMLRGELERQLLIKQRNEAALKVKLSEFKGRKRQFGEDNRYLKRVIQEGSGKMTPEIGDTLTLHMVGEVDGSVFVSTRREEAPVTVQFVPHQFVPGLVKCIRTMKQGERCKVHVPASLARSHADASKSPSNSTLDYDLELLHIEKSEKNLHKWERYLERKRAREKEAAQRKKASAGDAITPPNRMMQTSSSEKQVTQAPSRDDSIVAAESPFTQKEESPQKEISSFVEKVLNGAKKSWEGDNAIASFVNALLRKVQQHQGEEEVCTAWCTHENQEM